jgi:hypothetical protein
MNTHKILVAALVAALPLLVHAQQAEQKKPAVVTAPPATAPAPAAAPGTAPIGVVTLVTGRATVTSAGATRNLSADDPIHEGETVSVGPNSYANLKFNDGGRVLLRPNTEFAVESFRFAVKGGAAPAAAAPGAAAAVVEPTAVSGNAFFRLVRGGFRAVSGLLGKADRAAYKVTTPAATIGIRGTDFEVVTCTDDCPSQARAAAGATDVASTSLEGLELAQAGGGGGSGVIVATNEGAIVMRTSRGDTVVNVGQVALALANGQTFMLNVVPDALLLHPTPPPADCE